MENVPKIVKERLKSAAIAVDHPDANMLTAFSERTLAERERGRVLEHLANCSECREAVVLAFPAEETGLAAVRPIRGEWLTWPRLRWGLVATGVIVVGSFGLLRYERTNETAPVALQSTRADSPTNEAQYQSRSVPDSAEKTQERKALSVRAENSLDLAVKSQIDETQKKAEFIAEPQAPRDEKAGSGSPTTILRGQTLAHGPKPPTQWQQNLNANAANQRTMFPPQVPAPAPPASTGTEQTAAGVMVSAQSSPTPQAAAPVASEKQSRDLNALAMQRQSVAPLSSRNSGAEVARAKDAEPPANAPQAHAGGAYEVSETSSSNFSPSGSLVPESARWAINSAGGLQRSFDQGKNWESIDVSNSARETSAVNLLAMKSSPAKTDGKNKADAKLKPIIFRAVAANGPDVWAGGSETALFHSTDSGDHWIRIQPSWRGVQLNGDILSLQFADPQHGRIVTSTAEIWTTADAGQTWDKH